MDNIYIIFLIVAPISMFLSGFLIARQLRALENVPIISMLLVQKRLLISAVMGIFVSGLFSVLTFLGTKFSAWGILAFVIMFLVAAASYYFGVTTGWGRSLSTSENTTPINSDSVTILPNNVTVDDTLNVVKITINTPKRWIWFVMSMFQWVMMGFCALPIFGFMLIAVLGKFLPKNISIFVWVFVGGLVLYLIHVKFQEALEYIFDKEIIEIDNLSVRIEKSGLGLKNKKEYPADNIKKITAMFSVGGTNVALKRSRFNNSNMPAFMMWHNRGLMQYRSFGRAIDLADAQSILETIYDKFPQYKG